MDDMPDGYDRATLEAMAEDMWIDGAYDEADAEEIRTEMDCMSTERLAATLQNRLGDGFATLYHEYGE